MIWQQGQLCWTPILMAFLNQCFLSCSLVVRIPIKVPIKFTFASPQLATTEAYRFLQVSGNIMSSSGVLNEPIVALEGGATVQNSTFVFLHQILWVTLSEFPQTNFLIFLILDAGAVGPTRTPGPDVVSCRQMFLQFSLIRLAWAGGEIVITETAGSSLESQSEVSFLQDCHDMFQSRPHIVAIFPVLYFAPQQIELWEKNI